LENAFWLKIDKDHKSAPQGNTFYPISKDFEPYIVADGTYNAWKNAFKSIDDWFSAQPADGWRNQWSWRTDRVKKFNGRKKF
jgi:hypothetical protein